MIMTSLPLSVLTSSIHFVVCWKELTSEIQKGEREEAEHQYSGEEKPQLWKRESLWQEDNKEVDLQGAHILTKSDVNIWNDEDFFN